MSPRVRASAHAITFKVPLRWKFNLLLSFSLDSDFTFGKNATLTPIIAPQFQFPERVRQIILYSILWKLQEGNKLISFDCNLGNHFITAIYASLRPQSCPFYCFPACFIQVHFPSSLHVLESLRFQSFSHFLELFSVSFERTLTLRAKLETYPGQRNFPNEMGTSYRPKSVNWNRVNREQANVIFLIVPESF